MNALHHRTVAALVAADGDIPLINAAGIKAIIVGIIGIALMFGGLVMVWQHRKNSPRQQAEHGVSALIGIGVFAAGLVAATIVAGMSGLLGQVFHA